MTILLNHDLSTEKVRSTEVVIESKFGRSKLPFDRPKLVTESSKIDLETPIQYKMAQIEFQLLYHYFNGQI